MIFFGLSSSSTHHHQIPPSPAITITNASTIIPPIHPLIHPTHSPHPFTYSSTTTTTQSPSALDDLVGRVEETLVHAIEEEEKISLDTVINLQEVKRRRKRRKRRKRRRRRRRRRTRRRKRRRRRRRIRRRRRRRRRKRKESRKKMKIEDKKKIFFSILNLQIRLRATLLIAYWLSRTRPAGLSVQSYTTLTLLPCTPTSF